MKLSVLIATIPGREEKFKSLVSNLRSQSEGEDVEILTLYDEQELPIGNKRQRLLETSKGEYVVFFDDDDLPANTYIEDILDKLEENPDCVCFLQHANIDNVRVGIVRISNDYEKWEDNVHGYLAVRTPYHKTPMKREIALEIGFDKGKRYAEDHDFTIRLKESGLIKTEAFINKILYYYKYSSKVPHDQKYGFDKQEKLSKASNMIDDNGKLIITHNAGLFSCCTIALMDIIQFVNRFGKWPEVDRSRQFAWYKEGDEDLSVILFTEIDHIFPDQINVTTDYQAELQFTDYKKILFNSVRRARAKYFNFSNTIFNYMNPLANKYDLTFSGNMYKGVCAVFYRGNDKNRETQIASYQEFINKAKQIKSGNPFIKFFLLPDETEFKDAFMGEFPDTLLMEETRHMPKQDSLIVAELPREERRKHAIQFFSEVRIASQCEHLITHSGNGGLWAALYRGHNKNIHQYLNGQWL